MINLDRSNVSFGNTITLSQESTDILSRLKNINSHYLFKADAVLVNKLQKTNPIELTKILNQFFMDIVQEGCKEDPLKFLDRLAEVIPFAKMQEAVKEDIEDALIEANSLFKEAKHYLEISQSSASPSIRARFAAILDSISSLLETIVLAFGIGTFFKPSESDIDAEFKSQKIMMLIGLFSMITSTLLPAIGDAGRLVVGGIFLAISALSVIWPFIKPKPAYLPANAENLTRQGQKGKVADQARRESLDKIANIIKMNRHAILVGPSRVGKSLTAKAFAQAIEKGEYSELEGMVVFRINATDLLGEGNPFEGGNKILKKIREAMGPQFQKVVLVLDEIHMTCKDGETMADRLKTYLDEGGDFPHVIGITTVEEYENYVKNNTAFALRFDKVSIKNTNKAETIKILADILLGTRARPLIQDNALEYLYQKAFEIDKDAPQPTTSIRILKQCINQTEKTQRSPTQKKIVEISTQISSLRSQMILIRDRQKRKDFNTQINECEKQLLELKEIALKEQQELNKLFKSKEMLERVIKETYSSVLKISLLSQKNLTPTLQKQLNRFLLLNRFLRQSLEASIETRAKALGVKAVIDESLINEVVDVPA